MTSAQQRKTRLLALEQRWAAAWPRALEAWSRFTRLSPPRLCLTKEDATAEGLSGAFAMIRLVDQAVIVSLPEVTSSGVEDFAVEILAHEVGHHVLAPANLSDHARCIARMRYALPTIEPKAPMVANLYTDLLINDRLERAAGLRMSAVFRQLKSTSQSRLFSLYLRIYELLWSLGRGELGAPFKDDRLEGDAVLGMRLIRSYAREWLDGAGRFAALLLPYLIEEARGLEQFARLGDTLNAGQGGLPDGLTEVDPEDAKNAVHPALDPLLSGIDDLTLDAEAEPRLDPQEVAAHAAAAGQTRTPYVYGEILRAAGVRLPDDEIAARYYRERALPWLVPFPTRRGRESTEPLPEGLEPWDIGHPLDQADWLESILVSPRVVPGMTTVQRQWGTAEGREPERVPVDLDLYIDSSGSMPHPYQQVSYLTLAGAIMALSALRAGARVQAVLFSDKYQVLTSGGFVRDEMAILRVLAGFFGGGTQFPIPYFRNTYAGRKPGDRPVHVLVISDDGVSTMFDNDERNNSGFEIARMALAKAGGGGSPGKSSLAATLAREYATLHVPEFGRELWEQRAGQLVFEDMVQIAKEQIAREQAAAAGASRWLFCDTSPLTTLFYSLDLFGRAAPELEQLAARSYDLVALCAPDFEFVQDGTRRDPAFRDRQDRWYREELLLRGVPFVMLGGTPEDRVATLVRVLRDRE